jgi:hypothetical protein
MNKLDFKIGDIEVYTSAFGVNVNVPHTTSLGSRKVISITVNEEGLNFAATGTLNDSELVELNDAIVLAKLIKKYHYKNN